MSLKRSELLKSGIASNQLQPITCWTKNSEIWSTNKKVSLSHINILLSQQCAFCAC